jgi:hypothetical protein
VEDALRPFFATWTTSLIGSDLDLLQSLSEEHCLRDLVKTLIIEDDSAKVDIWMIAAIPSVDQTYNIWPRNDAGIAVGSDSGLGFGIFTLANILRRGLLQPTEIRVKDYRIAVDNLRLCPETDQIRARIGVVPPDSVDIATVTSLMEDLVDYGNLDVTCLGFGLDATPGGDLRALHKRDAHRFYEVSCCVMDPYVAAASIGLPAKHNTQQARFSTLRDVDVRLDPDGASYWLELFFYSAMNLDTLFLEVKDSSTFRPWLDAKRVVPQLVELKLSASNVSAEDLLAMLAASKKSLRILRLRTVRLVGQSKWRDVFTTVAKEHPGLRSLSIGGLYEDELGSMTVDFPGLKTCVPDEYRPGLRLLEKGHVFNRRIASVDYEGPHSGVILEKLALCVASRTPGTPSEQCSCPRHKEYTEW